MDAQQSKDIDAHKLLAPEATQGLHATTPGHASDHFAYHVEVAANFQIACTNIQQWIIANDLKREQIVAISSNESAPVDGDAILTVVYRRQSDPTMGSLATLQYHLISSVQDWDEQYASALENPSIKSADILSLTYTARNLGQINIQVIWYLPAAAPDRRSDGYTFKHFTSKSGHADALQQALSYLNTWVAPHRLVSLSAFEDDHPNTIKQLFHVVVLVKGLIAADAVTNQSAGGDQIVGPIYHADTLFSDDGWEQLLTKVVQKAEVRDRAALSTFNWSSEGGARQAAIVLGWSKTHEDLLVDSSRGGCSCSIF